jgi:hypothetical protein
MKKIFKKAIKMAKVPLICIYDHPEDYPNKFVARLWDGNVPTEIMVTADTLDGIRAKIPNGMVRLECNWRDDPAIVETWI